MGYEIEGNEGFNFCQVQPAAFVMFSKKVFSANADPVP